MHPGAVGPSAIVHAGNSELLRRCCFAHRTHPCLFNDIAQLHYSSNHRWSFDASLEHWPQSEKAYKKIDRSKAIALSVVKWSAVVLPERDSGHGRPMPSCDQEEQNGHERNRQAPTRQAKHRAAILQEVPGQGFVRHTARKLDD